MFFILPDRNSTNVTLSNLVLNAVSTSLNKPVNTDGFDTSESSYVTIEHNYVRNGDDCVSFKNGSNYITVNNITCIKSHDLSVGSLGLTPERLHIVKNIYASNARMTNCSMVTRIKFYPGGPSHGTVIVSNVTFKDITVENTALAVQIDNCYESDPDLCKKYPSAAKLLDITFINITGTTSQLYDSVVGKIDCSPNGTCDLTFNKWPVTTPSGNSTVVRQYFEHPSGITCKSDAFH